MTLKEFIWAETVYAQDTPVPTEASCKKDYGAYFYDSIEGNECKCKKTENDSALCKDPLQQSYMQTTIQKEQAVCESTIKYSTRSKDTGNCECENGLTADGQECLVNQEGTLGISCSAEQLINNTCRRNINKTLGIRQSDTTPNPTLLLQDIVLGATSFVGTILMIALIYLGIKAVMAGAGDSDELGEIKTKIKSLGIGLGLIISSYTIIRIIQYVARGY